MSDVHNEELPNCPKEFECSITAERMKDPVLVVDGHHFIGFLYKNHFEILFTCIITYLVLKHLKSMKRQGNCCSSTQDTSASQAALSTLDFPGVAIPTDVLKVIFSFLLDTKDNCRNSFSSWRKRETLNRLQYVS